MLKLVTEERQLRRKSQRTTLSEGKKIAEELLKFLKNSDEGIGLAANQVGIDKKVCVVNVERPLFFVNPEVVEASGRIIFEEGCLSFPGKTVITERYRNFVVKCDNYKHPMRFDMDNMLECVCVQHEIDHLDGITMFDRETKRMDIMGYATI